jgi:hypothetical protein
VIALRVAHTTLAGEDAAAVDATVQAVGAAMCDGRVRQEHIARRRDAAAVYAGPRIAQAAVVGAAVFDVQPREREIEIAGVGEDAILYRTANGRDRGAPSDGAVDRQRILGNGDRARAQRDRAARGGVHRAVVRGGRDDATQRASATVAAVGDGHRKGIVRQRAGSDHGRREQFASHQRARGRIGHRTLPNPVGCGKV